MTDNEIIKALERNAKYITTDVRTYKGLPLEVFSQATLDLINRQKAEIERLEKELNTLTKQCYKSGIKDFAERLKDLKHECGCNYRKKPVFAVTEDKIDNLVKEMTEGKDAGKDI
jgi:hypothetical protein